MAWTWGIQVIGVMESSELCLDPVIESIGGEGLCTVL